jgi:uncharacterized protein
VTLLYNCAILAVDVAAIWLVSRRRGLIVWCATMACAGVAAIVLGGLLGGYFEDHFGIFRLWAYGVFGHGPALLAVTAVLWRRSRPRLAGAAIAGAAAVLLVAADAFLIEPHWLEVSHWQFTSPKIRRPVRIVVVADLQTNRIGPYERDTLRRALAEKPDLILLAGDYLQARREKREALQRQLHDLLREIRFTAPRGAFAVRGNADPFVWPEVFKGLDVTAVVSSQSFDLGDIGLTCLGLIDSYDTKTRVENPRPDRFHLVLGHVPNFALGTIDADLLVAGHTHGGQVRLPWIGPMITHSRVPNAWAAGLTELSGGRRLLVCRGIGMERGYAPPMRFLCRPELMVIDLLPEAEKTAVESR